MTVNGYTFSTENLLYFYSGVGPTALSLAIVIYTDDDTDAPEIPGFGFTGSPTTECDDTANEPSDCIAPFVLYHDLERMDSCDVSWYDEAGIFYNESIWDKDISVDYAGWYLQAGGYESPTAAVAGNTTCDELEALHTFTNRLGSVYADEMPFGGFRDEIWSKIYNQIKIIPTMDTFWKSSYLEADSVFYALYFASYQGLHLSYPAKSFDSTYNPLIRPWYRLAASHPDAFTVTTPYIDFSSGELVASGATVITAPNSSYTFGVAAFDYEFSEFLSYWDDTLSAVCQQSDGHYCYLIDSNAFLLHYDGIENDVNDDDISYKFFGDFEPTLMQSLMDIGFFTNSTDANYLVLSKMFLFFRKTLAVDMLFMFASSHQTSG